MQLIGMLDSPYVRRAAISLRMLGIPFEHRPLSVFRDFDAFRAINPLVKAPTLVADDGALLVDSSLIIDWAESRTGRSLLPAAPGERFRALQRIGAALTAMEKSVQVVYERKRAPESRDADWLARVGGQLHAAHARLERALEGVDGWFGGAAMGQDDVSVAVAWRFTQLEVADVVDASRYPKLAAFSARAERHPDFVALPPA